MSPVDLAVRSHAALERMVSFELRVVCKTGLHIGAGKTANLVGSDLPVIRDRDGRPFIPGSSLRGVLRAAVFSLCDTLQLDAYARRATPAGGPSGANDLATRWKEIPLGERLFGRIGGKDDLSYGSRLQISDLAWADANAPVEVELRDGVAIDRETRTAARATGGKFDLEVVPAGSAFAGRVRLKNPADYEVGLLAQVLWMLDQGLLLLGGKSARGLGWVSVEVTRPWERTAQQILTREAPADSERALGPIDDHCEKYLDALAELRRSADEARAKEVD